MTNHGQIDTEQPRAIVTGGSRGLGAVIATYLVGNGYEVIITARDEDQLDETARTLAPFEGFVRAIQGDIKDPVHRETLGQEAIQSGGLDILVNNAAGFGQTPLTPLDSYPLRVFQRLFDTNVTSQLGIIQETLPGLRRRNGLIVNITSDAAVGGYPGWGGYGATKAALDLVSMTLSAELDDVGVVSVDPGAMNTHMHRKANPTADTEALPEPEVTLPFWSWLFGQTPHTVSGHRLEAQSATWEVAP